MHVYNFAYNYYNYLITFLLLRIEFITQNRQVCLWAASNGR